MHLVLVLYALFASVFTIGKTGLQYAQPFFLVGSRMMMAGAILLVYQLLIKGEKISLNRRDLFRVLRLSLFNIYLTNVFEFWGLKYLTSFKTCFIYSLSPFLSALFCYFLFSERLTPKKWLGLLIGFIGFIPILLAQSTSEELTGGVFFFSWAELAVITACVSSVYGWILLSQLVKESSLTPMSANGLSMLIGGAFALGHSMLAETWDPLPVSDFFPFLECAILLMVVSNFLAYNLYGFLLKRYSPTFISFAGFTTPMFTVLFGWFFLGEVATLPFYLSSAVVFVGLTLFHQEELKKEYVLAKEAV